MSSVSAPPSGKSHSPFFSTCNTPIFPTCHTPIFFIRHTQFPPPPMYHRRAFWTFTSSREITAALTAEKHLATISGDMLAFESTRVALNLRSEIGFSPSTISSIKDARFQGLISQGVDDAPRPKPQRPPNPGGDPIHWFAALPPPALRKTQKCFFRGESHSPTFTIWHTPVLLHITGSFFSRFFRGVETCVELANYKVQMMRAARKAQLPGPRRSVWRRREGQQRGGQRGCGR